MAKTSILWTEFVWNPITGCTKLSTGCTNCYAARESKHLKGMGQKKYEHGFQVTLHPKCLSIPKKRKKPTVYFVNSMSDLFHDKVPDDFIVKVFSVMNECPQHTFQVLTKRSERLARLSPKLTWSPNIWMGVTVETKDFYGRIDDLRQTGAKVKWLSIEPLLGDLPGLPLKNIDWVVVGGESGPGSRPMNADWVRKIRDLCVSKGVPYFFKQWGGVHKKKTGRTLDGRVWDEYPAQKGLVKVVAPSTATVKPQATAKVKAKADPVPACIYNEQEFSEAVRKLVSAVRDNQHEIGRLIYHYIKEHGHQYGDRIYDHVADLAGISLRSLRNYHNFYQLTVDFKDLANLPNVCRSTQYEIARLVKDHPEPKQVVEEIVNKAVEGKWTTNQTAKMVTEALRMVGKGKRRGGKQNPPPPAPDPLELTPEKQCQIEQVAEILSYVARDDAKYAPAVNRAAHINSIRRITNELLNYYDKLVKHGEGYSLQLDLQKMARRATNLLKDIADIESTNKTKGKT
jgi:protein gp37